MGGIIVDAEVFGRQKLKNPAPDRRRGHEILAARPLILAEQHGAVFDGDFYAQLLGQRDDRRPHFLDERQILLDGLRLVAADERRDHVDAQLVAGADHIFQMLNDAGTFFKVAVQRVGIVGERGNFNLSFLAVIQDVGRLFVAQAVYVDVADARVAALRPALRPAGDLHAGKAHFACRIDHFFKGPAIQNGADKTQFHCMIPPCFSKWRTLFCAPMLRIL